ncbi:MAG: HAMP domain-containing protein [Nitrospirae bacterium]|nr:HAMP domain-containing protein [Candidatus Manganitrophaceae bacterium]
MIQKSYRAKLIFVVLLLLFSTTVSFFFLDSHIERSMLIDQIQQRALLLGKTLQINLTQLILKTRQTDLAHISDTEKNQIRDFIRQFGEEEIRLDLYNENEGFHDLFIFDEDHRVIIDYPVSKEGRVLPKSERLSRQTLDKLQHNEIYAEIKELQGGTYLFITLALFNEKVPFGFARIEMALDESLTLIRKTRVISLLVAGGLFCVGTGIAIVLARNLTSPINQLAEAAALIGKGEFGLKLQEGRRDEIGQLMIAFNRMGEDLKRFEETRKRMETLEIASQFSAKMAHEIRNPLNSIGLIIDHVRDSFRPREGERAQKFIGLIDDIKGEVGRLNKIVEDFLRFAGPRRLELQSTDLREVIGEVVRLTETEALNHGIDVEVRHDPSLPMIKADYSQLRQAILNLFINAIQAMPSGGRLKISTRPEAVQNGREVVAVEFKDTGIGIAPENLPHLFEPYFTTKVNGFGLGLAIVSRIIEAHGGNIRVESQLGEGARFILTLPIEREAVHV